MKLIKKCKDGSHTEIRSREKKATTPQRDLKPWKMLVVDDEYDVHAMTALGLKDFTFAGRPLLILQAMSGYEARAILSKESDIAMVLVDIVMESDDAGLNLINYIRNDLQDRLVRIVVRTGQPGMQLERTVVEQYDIDDYKNKSELNVDKLYFAIRTTLKGYRDLLALEQSNRNLERKVQERTQQLEQQNKALVELNRDKNEFLGIAAHDLKNPLQTIEGSAELIAMTLQQAKFEGKKEIIEFANMISHSADRMFDLVTNLLDVNAIETGQLKTHFQQADIYPVLEKVVGDYKDKAAEKHISIQFKPQATEYLAYTDVNILYQVLDNLISNAVKYSPFDKQVFIRIFVQPHIIQAEIQDQGQGFSDEDYARLFNKFTRLSAKPTNGEHSTGLGLFIVKKLVAALNGEIDCKSKQGQGATFILTIPRESFI
ncbi:hybrid sensor histidine kinase/response regulator [Candidatus Albibeggiatoa sp. nov. NOAA]|uniref:ATP-binding response regulator n=1 Tax=Candidatus Albibeggiatoa sp. nov. NOAA TaxID=3162724 RepID=UPI0032F28ACD|nr:hybrid sensor histidine kinase/response regulator [Thiotrichaceae bacterium]